MSYRLFFILVIIFSSVIAYITLLNPDKVFLRLPRGEPYELPLMVVILGSFALGAIIAFLITFVRDFKRAFGDMQESRRFKRQQGVRDLYAEGLTSLLADNKEAAISAFQKVVLKEPNFVNAYTRLGDIARSDGKYSDAIHFHQRALRIDEKNLEVLFALEKDYCTAGRHEECIEILSRILSIDRDNIAARNRLRDLRIKRKEWGEAQQIQQQIIRLLKSTDNITEENNILAGIKYEIAKEKIDKQEYTEAIKFLRESIKINKEFLPAHLLLGDAYEKMQDSKEAIRAWEKGFEIVPSQYFLVRLEEHHMKEGRPSKILEMYNDAISKYPDDLSLIFNLGRVYYELEMIDEAADQFQRLEIRAPNFPGVHAFLGGVLEKRNQYANAMDEYRKALKMASVAEIPYSCSKCGNTTLGWKDKCEACGKWDSYKMTLVERDRNR